MDADREAAIQAAIDRQLDLERKAAAWDLLMRLYERHDTELIPASVARNLLNDV